jgi:hypothetical protein
LDEPGFKHRLTLFLETPHDPPRRASSTPAHPFSVYLATDLFPHKSHHYGLDGKSSPGPGIMAVYVAFMPRSG